MNETTTVLLITGFLGSGKTTFLNRIIQHFPKDLKLTILMNEFGEIGIDGTLVEGDDIDMMEISRGSIFCVCVKTDFIKGLYALNAKIKPDVLIIESTGVANPSDLKRDLQLPIFDNRFVFAEQFCIIDAAHFLEAFATFASVEKQLATSTVFIINKTDLAGKELTEKVKQAVRENHPDPQFFETTFSDIPLDSFPFLSDKSKESPDSDQEAASSPATLSSDELDAFISDLLDQPDLETTPPDQLVSVTYTWHGDTFDEIRTMAKQLPASVVRAKGFVREKDAVHLFSYVMGDWTIEPAAKDASEIKHLNMVVFIGEIEAMDGIAKAVTSGNWSARAVFQPMDLKPL
ncbi:MAG: GTP-binding protein [Desulfobulbaceae bacterium]|nr:GTP-binding protein [Desulfobulbaceae bacterium]